MNTAAPHRIALLFNANKVYDREIVAGIGEYVASTRAMWDLYMPDDLRSKPGELRQWRGDGVIADHDDPEIAALLAELDCPAVAIGSSFADYQDYPQDLPYVATDNLALVRTAHEHLLSAGLTRFALYSLPEDPGNRWAQEREHAFCRIQAETGERAEVFRGEVTQATRWKEACARLQEWLRSLPKPVGIIAVNDVRARHVLQACLEAGLAVPEEVAIVGIDNDPITRVLSRIPLTSVAQGTHSMGKTAAQLLHKQLRGGRERRAPVLVGPAGLEIHASSQHRPLRNPYVMKARYFIRQYAAQGIKAEQVIDHVGIARSTLNAHFQKELGCSVHDEIMQTKLARARTLLVEGSHSCSQIAVQCGFTSLQYMHAVFRRELGCTPREYQLAQSRQARAASS